MKLNEEKVNFLIKNKFLVYRPTQINDKSLAKNSHPSDWNKNIIVLDLIAKHDLLNKTQLFCYLYDLSNPPICRNNGCGSFVKMIGMAKGFASFCCRKCASEFKFKNKPNPFLGKKHSNDTRLKMKQNHADFTGDKNPFKLSLKKPENLAAHKQRCKNTWAKRDEQWRLAFSEKLRDRPLNQYAKQGRGHKCGRFYTDKCRDFSIFFRSSYEREFLTKIDDMDYILEILPEPVSSLYVNCITDKINRTFLDFKIVFDNNSVLFVEIKPKSLLNYKKAQLYGQWDYFMKNNQQYLILTEEAIRNSSLLNTIIWGARNGKFMPTKFIETAIRTPFIFAQQGYEQWESFCKV